MVNADVLGHTLRDNRPAKIEIDGPAVLRKGCATGISQSNPAAKSVGKVIVDHTPPHTELWGVFTAAAAQYGECEQECGGEMAQRL
jgi:hypothetical protein